MDRHRHIARQRSHFDSQHSLGDQFSGAGANNSNAQNALAVRIDDQLGHSIWTVDRNRSPRCAPGEFRHFDFTFFFFRLSFR